MFHREVVVVESSKVHRLWRPSLSLSGGERLEEGRKDVGKTL